MRAGVNRGVKPLLQRRRRSTCERAGLRWSSEHVGDGGAFVDEFFVGGGDF